MIHKFKYLNMLIKICIKLRSCVRLLKKILQSYCRVVWCDVRDRNTEKTSKMFSRFSQRERKILWYGLLHTLGFDWVRENAYLILLWNRILLLIGFSGLPRVVGSSQNKVLVTYLNQQIKGANPNLTKNPPGNTEGTRLHRT